MRYLTKRLTVKNDGFCSSKKPARDRAYDCALRYINKMMEKGWLPRLMPSAGNAFFNYEIIVELQKPKSSEFEQAMQHAKDAGWIIDKGKCVGLD